MKKSSKFLLVIPARMKSTRLPNKSLIHINGQSIIERTCNQVAKVVHRDNFLVATDHIKIKNHVEELGFQAELTSEYCLTGTDRIAEIAKRYDYNYFINVQGDEPLINPKDISIAINMIDKYPNSVINGYTSITNEKDYYSNTIPKLVFDNDEKLLYMSRSPIPGNKNNTFSKAWRQVCIYVFPRKELLAFSSKSEKSLIENEEDIEILRFLEMGVDVQMVGMSSESIAVDIPEDIKKVEKSLNENKKTIIWDFDGVILDSNKIRDKGFKITLQDHPTNQVAELLEFHRNNGGLSRYVKFKYFIEQIKKEKSSLEQINAYASKFSKIVLEELNNPNLIITDTLEFIRNNFQTYNMHIASGSDENELKFLCKELGIDKFFRSINGSPMPKNEIVKNIIECNSYNKKNCILIGDSVNDKTAAFINKIKFLGYNYNDSPSEVHIINSFEEVNNLI